MKEPVVAHNPGPAAQGVAFLSAAQAASVVLGYTIHVVLSRVLGSADYGRFVVALSVILWVKVALGSFLLPGVGKIVSEDHRRLRDVLAAVGRWYCAGALATWILLAVAAPFLAAALGDRALLPVLIVAGLEIPVFAASSMARRLLSSLRQYATSAAVLVAYGTGRALGACSLALFGLGVVGVVAGQALGSAFAGLLGVVFVLRVRSRLDPEPYSGALSRAWSWTATTLPSNVALVTLMSLDLWLVKALTGDPTVVGAYAAAFAVSRLPDFMAQGLTSAVFARVSEALAGDRIALARSVATEGMRFLLIVFLPVSAVTAASSREILGLLFGANYTAASEVMVLLIIAVSLAATMKLMLELLAAADRPGIRLVLVTALVPVGLTLCFWLIPRYGLKGAAFASMVTMTAGAVASAALVRRVIGAQLPMGTAVRCGIAGLAVYAACRFWVTAGWLLVGKFLLLGVLYLALLLLLRELGRDDMDSMQRIFRGVKVPFFSSIGGASSPRNR